MKCRFCDRFCKNDNSLRNHERLCKTNPNHQLSSMQKALAASRKRKSCQYCDKPVATHSVDKHERSCKKNPATWTKECPVCSKKHGKEGITCSHSCSNTYFRSGINNPNWKNESYRSTCWVHHEKKCIVCDEEKIVAVHHVNENREDNRPENLVPLCPTHHQYVHSRYRDEVQPLIDEYLKQFLLRFA